MISRRLVIIKKLAEFFAESGQIFTKDEYQALPSRPVSIGALRTKVGSWSRCISWCEKYYPDLMAIARQGLSEAPLDAPVFKMIDANDSQVDED